MMSMKPFNDKYGPWAVVAGASRGLGLAFSHEVARLGQSVVMVSENETELSEAVAAVQNKWRVKCKSLVIDLATENGAQEIVAATASLDVGLLICNATHVDLGGFLQLPLADHLGVVDVNCRAPLALAYLYGNKMRERPHSGMVLMASLTGFIGTPYVATYGASKSFTLALAEGIGAELRQEGIDVLVAAPGATATENYLRSIPDGVTSAAPLMTPDVVATQVLGRLGKQRIFVPGWKNQALAVLLSKLLPRKWAVRLMGNATQKLYGPTDRPNQ